MNRVNGTFRTFWALQTLSSVNFHGVHCMCDAFQTPCALQMRCALTADPTFDVIFGYTSRRPSLHRADEERPAGVARAVQPVVY